MARKKRRSPRTQSRAGAGRGGGELWGVATWDNLKDQTQDRGENDLVELFGDGNGSYILEVSIELTAVIKEMYVQVYGADA